MLNWIGYFDALGCGENRDRDAKWNVEIGETARRAKTQMRLKGSLVRKGGLEPPRFYPPDPKSGASANSATFARLDSTSYGLTECLAAVM